jgi:hypothetical protein
VRVEPAARPPAAGRNPGEECWALGEPRRADTARAAAVASLTVRAGRSCVLRAACSGDRADAPEPAPQPSGPAAAGTGRITGQSRPLASPRLPRVGRGEVQRDRQQERPGPPVDGVEDQRLVRVEGIAQEPDHKPKEGHARLLALSAARFAAIHVGHGANQSGTRCLDISGRTHGNAKISPAWPPKCGCVIPDRSDARSSAGLEY